MMRLRRILSIVVTFAVAAALGVWGFQEYGPEPAQAAIPLTVPVQRGNLTAAIAATGNIAVPTESRLGFQTSGTVQEILVGLGAEVQTGEALARLDPTPLEEAVRQAEANYRSAEAKLQQLQTGLSADEIGLSEATVEAARVKLEQARAGATNDVDQATRNLEAAQLKLDQVKAGGSDDDVAAARSQLESALARLEALRSPSAGDLQAAEAALASTEAKLSQLLNPRLEELQQAEASLASAQAKLEHLLRPSPEDLEAAEVSLAAAQAKLDRLLQPTTEDLAAAQSQLDQAQIRLAELLDAPPVAAEDLANAELAVRNAQISLDKARNDAATNTTLSDTARDALVKQAEIALAQAQNNLSKLQSQRPSDWDIRQQQLAVEAAQASLDKLRQPSAADVVAAEASVQQAETALAKLRSPSAADIASAEASVQQAQASVAKLVTPDTFALRQAEAAVAEATVKLQEAQENAAFAVGSAENALTQAELQHRLKLASATAQDITIAQAAVDTAQVQLDQAQRNLANATLTAPFAGIVSSIDISVGEQVTGNTAAITLVDLAQLRAEVLVNETDIARVRAGQETTLTFEALLDQQVAGNVLVVAPTASINQGVVSYQVLVGLDPEQSVAVRPGMTATAMITTESREGVVVVPNRAIRREGTQQVVDVLSASGETETRPVQTGLANDQSTEITSGLQPDDTVVIPQTTTGTARVSTPFGTTGGGTGPGGGRGF